MENTKFCPIKSIHTNGFCQHHSITQRKPVPFSSANKCKSTPCLPWVIMLNPVAYVSTCNCATWFFFTFLFFAVLSCNCNVSPIFMFAIITGALSVFMHAFHFSLWAPLHAITLIGAVSFCALCSILIIHKLSLFMCASRCTASNCSHANINIDAISFLVFQTIFIFFAPFPPLPLNAWELCVVLLVRFEHSSALQCWAQVFCSKWVRQKVGLHFLRRYVDDANDLTINFGYDMDFSHFDRFTS